MNFKKQTLIFLEGYNSEILEEGINNNSASKKLKSIIDKVEKSSDKNVSKTLATLRSGYEAFSKLENAYKSASSEEKRNLKKEYKELQSKYSYQLKRLHMSKGAAAAIIAAALAVTAGSGIPGNSKGIDTLAYGSGSGKENGIHNDMNGTDWLKAKSEVGAKYGYTDDSLTGNYIANKEDVENKIGSRSGRSALDRAVFEPNARKEMDNKMRGIVSGKLSLEKAYKAYDANKSKNNYNNLMSAVRDHYKYRYIDTKMLDKYIELRKKGVKDDRYIRTYLNNFLPNK